MQQLLQGTNLVAEQTGPLAWRIIVRRAEPLRNAPNGSGGKTLQSPPIDTVSPPEIVVTATKRADNYQTAALSAQIVTGLEIQPAGPASGTAAVAALSDAMITSNIGPGRNRSFLRGVGDSPFNGSTQATVAVELGEARITFNAPDPDLRLVDIERVELLKGPQGPLHGTGALGGVYRIVPSAPRLDAILGEAALGLEALSGGSTGLTGSAMVNLPLKTDSLALRVVGYASREPGWIDTDGPSGKNSNISRMRGGRLALRWSLTSDWSADLSGAVQFLHVADSQYANGARSPYHRIGSIAEPHDNDIRNVQFTVRGNIAGAKLVSVTSWTMHEVDSILDASEAASLFGTSGPLQFEDDRIYHVFNQEVRLSGGDRVRWLAGASYLRATTRLLAQIEPATGASSVVGDLNEANAELAAFVDLSIALGRGWRIDGGARLFRSSSDDERRDGGAARARSVRHTGAIPNLAVSWQPNARQFYFFHYASAFRPAGLTPFGPTAQAEFESDELKSFEAGMRLRSADGRLTVNATAYFGNWDHIQSDYLLPNGLIGTRNSGTGRIYGLEAQIGWSSRHWHLDSGFDVQHARLESAGPGVVVPSDNNLPVVPKAKAHVNLQRNFDLGPGLVSLGGRLNWIGASRLSLDPALNRKIGAHGRLDLDASYALGTWTIDAAVSNAIGSHADTFGYGIPFPWPSPDNGRPCGRAGSGLASGKNFPEMLLRAEVPPSRRRLSLLT